MEIFLLIIIGLIVWFVIRPIVVLRNRWKQMERQAREFYGRQAHDPRRARPEQPRKKGKKIDPTVGEYVEFTETAEKRTDSTGDGTTHSTVAVEEQITDVSWEDIPEK